MRAPVLVGVALLLVVPGASHAATPVFGSPATVMAGTLLDTGTALDGTVGAATVDEATGRLFVSRRPADENVWSQPEVVATGVASRITASYARTPAGDEAVTWLRTPNGSTELSFGLRTRSAGDAEFGAEHDLTLSPPPGVTEQWIGVPAVTRTTDGLVAVAACVELTQEVRRAVVWTGTPDGAGTWTDRGRCVVTVRLAADARGGADLLWTGADSGTWNTVPDQVRVAHRAPGAAGFGATAVVSDPGSDADNGLLSRPALLVATDGRASAVWNAPEAPGALLSGLVRVARRDAAGRWSSPLQPTDSGMVPSVAQGDDGTLAAVWFQGAGIGGAIAASGAAFGTPFTHDLFGGALNAMPVALDALGDVLILHPGPREKPEALVRWADGTIDGPAELLDERVEPGTSALAADRYGNGIALLSAGDRAGRRLLAVPYSAAAPAVRAMRLSARTLAFDVSEPARMSLQVIARGRTARRAETSVLPRRGRERLALTVAQRRLAHRAGARIVLRVRDAGPRSRTIRRSVRALHNPS